MLEHDPVIVVERLVSTRDRGLSHSQCYIKIDKDNLINQIPESAEGYEFDYFGMQSRSEVAMAALRRELGVWS